MLNSLPTDEIEEARLRVVRVRGVLDVGAPDCNTESEDVRPRAACLVELSTGEGSFEDLVDGRAT